MSIESSERGTPRNAASREAGATKARIVQAAFGLFASGGFDGTTVDAIAESAGIARRTFFRYFPSKDDVIFPDHDALLVAVQQYLQASAGGDPVRAVCGGVRLVFRSYVENAEVSVARYRLTRDVPALRQRELSSVSRYERAFSAYLRERRDDVQGVPMPTELYADVVAAAVVAAHNFVLRDWLRGGGSVPPAAALVQVDAALDAVAAMLSATLGKVVTPDSNDATVVAVIRSGRGVDDVVQRLTNELRETS